jgi:hypothetical protein
VKLSLARWTALPAPPHVLGHPSSAETPSAHPSCDPEVEVFHPDPEAGAVSLVSFNLICLL